MNLVKKFFYSENKDKLKQRWERINGEMVSGEVWKSGVDLKEAL